MRLATLRIRSKEPTEVPPYFWTISIDSENWSESTGKIRHAHSGGLVSGPRGTGQAFWAWGPISDLILQISEVLNLDSENRELQEPFRALSKAVA